MEIKMNESSSFYANNATDDEKARKTLTLKSARTIDGPETLIDPQIKRKLKIVGQQLKRQKIVGITGMILVGALLCCYIPYDIVYLRRLSRDMDELLPKLAKLEEIAGRINVQVWGNCDGMVLNDETRIIQSPNYPARYKNNLDCYWNILSPVGTRLNLMPINIVMEKCGEDCTCDYIEILEESNDKINGKKVCSLKDFNSLNRVQNQTFESSVNSLLIHFHTDPREMRKGFQINYNMTRACHTNKHG